MEDVTGCIARGVHQGSSDKGLDKVTVPEANVHFLFCSTQQKVTLGPEQWRNLQIDFFFKKLVDSKFS